MLWSFYALAYGTGGILQCIVLGLSWYNFDFVDLLLVVVGYKLGIKLAIVSEELGGDIALDGLCVYSVAAARKIGFADATVNEVRVKSWLCL